MALRSRDFPKGVFQRQALKEIPPKRDSIKLQTNFKAANDVISERSRDFDKKL